jgi:hypothetical protein
MITPIEYQPEQAPSPEPDALRYARQTRNAVVTIAVIVAVAVLASVITGIADAVAIHHIAKVVTYCQSAGGIIPGC